MWKRVRTQPQHLPLRHTLIRTPAPTHVVVTRTLQRLFIDTHVYLVRYLESDSSVFSFLFAFSLNPYERNARRTSTPQETRQGEEKEREREMDEKERSKERGSKSALSHHIYVFIYFHFYAYSKHRLIREHGIEIYNDHSDNSDATFYVTSNRVCR